VARDRETRLAADERLRRRRECYTRGGAGVRRDLLVACDAESPLQVADLERLAVASFLLAEVVASDRRGRRRISCTCRRGTDPVL
jgi:hypothetical protein